MAVKSILENKALATVRYLKDQDLLTGEHELTVALIKELCASWEECTSVTQKASLAKEIRASLESLPKPEIVASDEVADFFAEVAAL